MHGFGALHTRAQKSQLYSLCAAGKGPYKQKTIENLRKEFISQVDHLLHTGPRWSSADGTRTFTSQSEVTIRSIFDVPPPHSRFNCWKSLLFNHVSHNCVWADSRPFITRLCLKGSVLLVLPLTLQGQEQLKGKFLSVQMSAGEFVFCVESLQAA